MAHLRRRDAVVIGECGPILLAGFGPHPLTPVPSPTVANFAAYTFAPPILVTPLGALSVLIGSAEMRVGKRGLTLAEQGCPRVLLPQRGVGPDRQDWMHALPRRLARHRLARPGRPRNPNGRRDPVLRRPAGSVVSLPSEISLADRRSAAFMLYCIVVLVFTVYMIHTVVPRYGTREPIVYLSICSLVGSVGVMSIKGLGVAIKLTFAGNNQLTHFSTYVFAIVVAVCIMVQMNYFNKALDQFSTNVCVNPCQPVRTLPA